MIQTRAIVISVEGSHALVESTQGGGCGNCNTENGCGSGKLSQLFGSKPRRFKVRNDGNALVGALVEVNLSEGVLLQSALLMYILPLVLLLSGAMLGAHSSSSAADSDAYSALGGFAGLVLGLLMVKGLSLRHRMFSSAQAVIL